MTAFSSLTPWLADDLGWFDVAGLVTLGVFALLGIWKGFAWQLGRLTVLVLGYAAALVFGGWLGPKLAPWLEASGNPEIPEHVARATLFVAVVALAGLIVWFAQRFGDAKPVTPLSRLLGAGAGIVLGSLILLAILTSLAMFLPGRGVARAAESSRSSRVGRNALEIAHRVLPGELGDGARRWHDLLDAERVAIESENGLPTHQPADATFRPSDGVTPMETDPRPQSPRVR